MNELFFFGLGFVTGVVSYISFENYRNEFDKTLEEIDIEESNIEESKTIRNGSLVYFDCDIEHDFLTKGKKYEVFNVDYDNETSFNILDDNGNKCFCLLKDCGYLGVNDWKVFKY